MSYMLFDSQGLTFYCREKIQEKNAHPPTSPFPNFKFIIQPIGNYVWLNMLEHEHYQHVGLSGIRDEGSTALRNEE